MSREEEDDIPRGVCTALACKCSCFTPKEGSPMYCGQEGCNHSIEWHHLSAKEIEV